jgi:hypothetical protein
MTSTSGSEFREKRGEHLKQLVDKANHADGLFGLRVLMKALTADHCWHKGIRRCEG